MSTKPVRVHENPVLEDALGVVEDAISRKRALIIVGNCWASYQGRASSKMESGERILMVKEDGSLLVHRSVGYEPVNWQPPGCVFHTSVSKDALSIRAVRGKPPESLCRKKNGYK